MPVILGSDGVVLREALLYAVHCKRKGSSFTTLYRQALSIGRMSDFWCQYHKEVQYARWLLPCGMEANIVGHENV